MLNKIKSVCETTTAVVGTITSLAICTIVCGFANIILGDSNRKYHKSKEEKEEK